MITGEDEEADLDPSELEAYRRQKDFEFDFEVLSMVALSREEEEVCYPLKPSDRHSLHYNLHNFPYSIHFNIYTQIHTGLH